MNETRDRAAGHRGARTANGPGAQVEVRGIEPRSVDPSAAASPSAADGEPSVGRTPSASGRPPYPESVSTPRSGNPGGSILLNDVRPSGAGTPQADGLSVLRQPVQTLEWHLWLFAEFLTRTPATSARFRHLSYRRRNQFTPKGMSTSYTNPVTTGPGRPNPLRTGASGGRLSGRSSRRPRPRRFRLRSWRRPRPGRGRRPVSRGAPPSVSGPPPGR